MKSNNSLVFVVLISAFLTACGPAKVLPLETVKPNETAFAIPLEGDTTKQMKFESIEFLNSKIVQNKQMDIPVRMRSTGRMWWDYEWIPTMRVIKVDRSLITRQWRDSGTTARKDTSSLAIESSESINFHIGVNLTALIQEEDASTYLYWHNTKTLTEVIDTNIKGFVQGVLAREFGSRTLEQAKTQKNQVFATAEKETKEHFKKFGITVLNLGNAGGLSYDDVAIQDAINKTQTSEMGVKVALQEKLAQDERNKKDVATAIASRQAAEEFAKAKDAQMAKLELEIKMINAEATLEAAKRWNGKVPESILPQGSNFMFGLDKPSTK